MIHAEIPFIPVCEPWLNGNELKYVTDAVSTGWISSNGKYVKAFEKAFAAYCDVRFGVAVCNGTVALHLALVSLGIGQGDEVILPDFTMIASAFAVCYTGAKPVFVDADKETWNIDTKKIEEKISPNTRAIMPVHIFGNPVNMSEITKLSKKHTLLVIEDAAEAHGAEYLGRRVGSFSSMAAFSFYANKNLTTGEGGMVVTNDEALYRKALCFKNLCFDPSTPRTYLHKDIGFNYRMSNLHAAIGLAQTEKANDYRERRRLNHALYKEYLSDVPGIVFQKDEPNGVNVCWMNTVVICPETFGRSKDEVVAFLKKNNIETRPLFTGMHRQPSLVKYGCASDGDYPVTDHLTQNGFYLPSATSLTSGQIQYVCTKIKDARTAI